MTVKRTAAEKKKVGFYIYRCRVYFNVRLFLKRETRFNLHLNSSRFMFSIILNGAMSSGDGAHCDGTRCVVLTGLGIGHQDLIENYW